jgi:hypothetical protein
LRNPGIGQRAANSISRERYQRCPESRLCFPTVSQPRNSGPDFLAN